MHGPVVVVGGGVIGLSSAWRVAQRGFEVTVVDPSPGRGASWVAAGMLAPTGEAAFGEEALTRLLMAGAERWPTFAAELSASSGIDIGYRRCGTVMVAIDAADRAVIDDLLAFQRRLGLEATRLSASGCRALAPALAPGVRGGAGMPGDHQVDNRKLVRALLEACRRSGVSTVTERVEAVVLNPDTQVTGVRLAGGEVLPAGVVVLAAGAGTGRIGGLPEDVLPPVRPVKGHVLRLQGTAGAPLLTCTVRGLVHGRPCYLVPRQDGSVVIGATSEERGFDTSVRAGAVHALLDDARALVPGVDELDLVECLAGLRPGSPDNSPYVGWSRVPGLAMATGHYRNGILLTPITAAAVESLLVDAGHPVDLAFPSPTRPRARAAGTIRTGTRHTDGRAGP